MTLHRFIIEALKVPFIEKGRDYDGWDCWGCVRCGLMDVFEIDLPLYLEYSTTTDYKVLKDMINNAKPAWVEINSNYQSGDVGVFTLSGEACHVGLFIDKKSVIHCEQKIGTVVETIRSPILVKRLEGVYRYARTIG